MTDWTAADLPSFAGRTVIITGANSGLGAITARELARNGAKIIMAVRNTGKGEAAAREITGQVEVRPLDLQDLSSVRQFADGVETADILINNAGVMAVPYAETVDGFESQIGTNHLGHFALTNLLLPKLTDRVVAVSSMAHWPGRISLDDLNWKTRRYRPWLAYSQSKLANLLFTSELQRRLDAVGSPLRAVAAHPGYSHTNLQGANRPPAERHPDVGRHQGVCHQRRLRRPANAVRRIAGPARRHLHRPPLRQPGPHPARRPQPGGARHGHRHRALGAVRAAHGHQISALSCRSKAGKKDIA
jgi:NAD(P)-dependent dehydrogenase (short-subunit alcohol dehydrogenase family)